MNLAPKNAEKFSCENCDFRCSKQSEWGRHILTRKHKILTNDQKLGKNAEIIYDCLCGKKYKHLPSLSHHKKICHVTIEQNELENMSENGVRSDPNENKHVTENNANGTGGSIHFFMNLFHEQLNENKEIKDLLIEQNKQMMAMISQSQTITNNNINSHNKTMNNNFNLNFFLNETCKDAMDIDDFIDYVKVKLDDFENFGRVGYPKAVGDIIIRNLNELDVRHRPIHCSDLKREVLHIKHDGVWHSDDTQKFMKKSIMYVANKNIKQIPKWQDMNPESRDCFTKSFDKYNKLCRASLGAATDEEEAEFLKKITSIVAKEVVIDKKKKY